MTTNNQCNHTDAIAKDMYETFIRAGDPYVTWDDLLPAERLGWRYVAEEALPIIGKHALGDVKDYLGIKASGASSWWRKALYWAGVGIAGAILGGWGMSLSGCGHSVDVTPDRTEVCKDGSCLVIEQGHISYSQAQPKTEVEPVVQVIPSKK
jgi:hypothetical protein